MSSDLRRRLVELSRWHDEWFTEHESGTEFRQQLADHNMHYVDMDADTAAQDEFHARADQIMGVTRQRGAGPQTLGE